MKKFIVVIVIILVLGGFVVLHNFHDKTEQSPVSSNIPVASGTPPNNNYKNGSFLGQDVSFAYGDIQVKVIIQNGKITDLQYLQVPSAGGHTSEVTSIATPILRQEAIQAQSSNVDTVSGATQTSEAFRQTLQSALDQAKS